jgi:Hemerythrin HHE cation binding domain
MTTSDPILYPRPRSDAESLRQDIFRRRTELRETLGELTSRLDLTAQARRRAAQIRPAPTGAGALAGISGLVAAALWRRNHRHAGASGPVRTWAPASVAALGATALAGALLLRRSRPVEEWPRDDIGGPGTPVRAAAALSVEDDIVDLLIEQHRRIERLFEYVSHAPAGSRPEALSTLVTALQEHERAEQGIVHPALGEIGDANGDAVRSARLAEEGDADRKIADLIGLGTKARGFPAALEALRQAVMAHATNEERDEFPLLRAHLPADRRTRMANQVLAAQADSW